MSFLGKSHIYLAELENAIREMVDVARTSLTPDELQEIDPRVSYRRRLDRIAKIGSGTLSTALPSTAQRATRIKASVSASKAKSGTRERA